MKYQKKNCAVEVIVADEDMTLEDGTEMKKDEVALCYESGVEIISKAAFEEKYEPVVMPFEEALIALKDSKKVRRAGWDKDVYLKITVSEVSTIAIKDGSVFVPWHSYQNDLLADDWEIVA